MKRKKKIQTPEPHWDKLVGVWFKFCRDVFGDVPVFDGSSPRDLKSIVKALKNRAITSGEEWTELCATSRLHHFLTFAYQDSWLKKNWLLSNLNRQKEKIFFNLRKIVNQNLSSVAPY